MRGSKTLVDFCHGLWDTRIDSDVVSSDGYEVSNLISREKSEKRKGFLAAGFVKPAVTILFSFPFPVDLYALNISLQVGAQKTRGLEIFAASLNARNQQDVRPTTITTEDSGKTRGSQDFRGSTPRPRIARTSNHCWEFSGLHYYQNDLNIHNIKQEFKNLFVQILRVRIPEGKIGHFLNPCFQPPPQDHCDSRIVSNTFANVHKCMLQHGQLLRRISHLVVRITEVHKGSVPCIGAVEVFGQPAQNSGTFVMNYATLISSRLKEENVVPNGLYTFPKNGRQAPCVGSKEGSSLGTLSGTGLPNGTSSLGDQVPEDFIDPITLSIMTLPVLLPSGTTIDQTTLEKHTDSEKCWGRPPSDPFTGLPLGTKVVPNAALKCRIDNFLLSSDVSVSNLGRTVGSLLDCQSTTKVKGIKERSTCKLQKNYKFLQKLSGVNKRTALTVTELDGGQAPLKRQKTGDLDKALEEALSARQQPAVLNHNLSVSSLVKTYGSKSNEKKCATDELTSHAGCPHQGQDSILFQLSCQHVICRRCLTGAVENKQCPDCKRNFDKNNVARVHSIYTNS